jgi:hypothetical protein
VERLVQPALARQLGRVQRRVRVRDPLAPGPRQAVLAEQPLVVRVRVEAVAPPEVVNRDALGRIFRVQVERQPFDLSAVPALEPRRALSRDVAERSYVVGPDPDEWWHTSALYPIV